MESKPSGALCCIRESEYCAVSVSRAQIDFHECCSIPERILVLHRRVELCAASLSGSLCCIGVEPGAASLNGSLCCIHEWSLLDAVGSFGTL